jgi:hypothetical protein
MAEQKRTQFAMQALGFADVFNLKIGDQKVSGHRVELSAPDGPSTGGGKQSVQHIKLIPDGGGTVTVAGSADQMEKKAEIRSWDYLAQQYAQRFKGKTLPIERTQYAALVKRMLEFFTDQGLTVVMVEAPTPMAAAQRPGASPSGGSGGAMMLVVLVVVAALAAGVFFFLRHKG